MRRNSRLIVFLIPPEKIVNGGILSIFSICSVSRQFKEIHKSEVLLCTYPGTKSYKKNDLFENDEIIYSFDEIVEQGTPKSLLIHVPEYASYDMQKSLEKYDDFLKAIPDLRVNIMNQNILLMQKPTEVAGWFRWTPHVTQTTAHNKYSSQELADEYNIPTHHLSTFVDSRLYKHIPYEEKDNLIVFSPDETAKRDSIIEKVKKHYPDYKFITIQNMRYEAYKETVARAKFTVTFGEGFDGYYVEAFFSDGVALAVYNDEFFPNKNFSTFNNTFTSYEDMLDNIGSVINQLDDPAIYKKTVQSNMEEIDKLYNSDRYVKNVENFYRGKFTYLPSQSSAARLIAEILSERDEMIDAREKLLAKKEKAINDQSRMIADLHTAIDHQDKAMQDILNSSSWKVTRPLRKASSALKKKRS